MDQEKLKHWDKSSW